MKDQNKEAKFKMLQAIEILQAVMEALPQAQGSKELDKLGNRLDNAIYAAEEAKEAIGILAEDAESEEAEARQAEEDEAEAREEEERRKAGPTSNYMGPWAKKVADRW